MEVYYGYDDSHYVNVTTMVFKKCLSDTGLNIPSSDNERSTLFGDPYPGFLKHILIIDPLGKKHKFLHTKEIKLEINSISTQLTRINTDTESNNYKMWWEKNGKFIKDPEERLRELQNRLTLEFGNFADEYPEQLLAMKFITPDNKVLEIGGNIGRNTLIIGTILNNPKNLVTLESDPTNAKLLQYNLELNNIDANVESSALSQQRLIQRGWNTIPVVDDTIPDGWKEVSTITYDNLIKKYNISFDTLVADCEGALFYILTEDHRILENINLVIIENDFQDIFQKMFVNEMFEKYGFKCIYTQPGGWGHCSNFFYEVWKKD
jgi:FkbM family methyltransferase